jgi:2,3-bisphosphoglycerate-independent phosphoglycerate mutase
MTRILFLFLDGVGLGSNDPSINPLVRARMPTLQSLLGGSLLKADAAPLDGERATLLALDACLGVPGVPQSATGQAALLTGQNVPAALGFHFGPKPNQAIAGLVIQGNLFSTLRSRGKDVAFLNAFPPTYFEGIWSGKRIYSVVSLAVTRAGLPLLTGEDMSTGRAVSADLTGQGWRTRPGMKNTPVITPQEAGRRLAVLAAKQDFSFFEYWLSDYAGHWQDMGVAINLLETFDQALQGLLSAWDENSGLILLTSDHGNLEDLSTRRHTTNPVPALLIGRPDLRKSFSANLHDLVGIAPAILRLLE